MCLRVKLFIIICLFLNLASAPIKVKNKNCHLSEWVTLWDRVVVIKGEATLETCLGSPVWQVTKTAPLCFLRTDVNFLDCVLQFNDD